MSILIQPVVRSFNTQSWGTTTNLSAPYVLNAFYECLTRNDSKTRYWNLDTFSLTNGFRTDSNNNLNAMVLVNEYKNHENQTKYQKLYLRVIDSRDGGTTRARTTISAKLFSDVLQDQVINVPTSESFGSASSNNESRITGGLYALSSVDDIAWARYWYYDLVEGSLTAHSDNTTGPSGWIIETNDAITLVLRRRATNNWQWGFHAGKIYTSIDLSDYNNFLDGSGILSGTPSFHGAGTNWALYWGRSVDANITGRSHYHDYSKIITSSNNSYTYPFFENISASEAVSSNERFEPYLLLANSFDGLIGYTKYIRTGSISSLNRIVDSDNGNISWINQFGSGANGLMYHIWEKNVSAI